MTDESSQSLPGQHALSGTDETVPHSARIVNYWLGGKDNYVVDRAAGDRYREEFPGIVDISRTGREFLGRAVRFLTGEEGIRQFLDVGTGLPTADNTHELAQRVAAECRIVYVDNDPMVLAHARALLKSTPEGAADYLDADLYTPEVILRGAAHTLDFDRPIALMLMGVLGHISDDEQARSIVDALLEPLVPGSYLVIGDGTNTDQAQVQAQQRYNEGGSTPYRLRSPEQLAAFFADLEVVEPGLVPCSRWRPENPVSEAPSEAVSRCAVGRKR